MNPEFKNTCFLPFALKNVIALFSCNAEHEGGNTYKNWQAKLAPQIKREVVCRFQMFF